MTEQQVQRHTVADELRRRIIDGEFAPGSRLSEAAIAERLDVSRNTLREAFRVLQEQGLVDHIAHRGVSVVSPAVADVVDIYRVRRTLECHALAHASPRHPSLAVMRAAIERSEVAVTDSDWRAAGSANMVFHEALVSLADSPRLDRSFRNVAAELRLAFLEIDDLEALHQPFVGRNRRVLERFVDEGPSAGVAEMEAYLIKSERVVLGAFARMGKR